MAQTNTHPSTAGKAPRKQISTTNRARVQNRLWARTKQTSRRSTGGKAPRKQISTTNYLELDDYMTALDDKSLNKLTTAQLMQRLKAHNLEWKGLKHELVERWKDYKLKEQGKNK